MIDGQWQWLAMVVWFMVWENKGLGLGLALGLGYEVRKWAWAWKCGYGSI